MDSFIPKSSFIVKCEYDDAQRQMTISFKTGTQQKYFYVYPSTWLSFKTSPNHSVYYAKAIKGKLMSVSLQKHLIGKSKSTPLHKQKLNRSLNDGNIYTNGHDTTERQRTTEPGKPKQQQRPAGNIPQGLGQR